MPNCVSDVRQGSVKCPFHIKECKLAFVLEGEEGRKLTAENRYYSCILGPGDVYQVDTKDLSPFIINQTRHFREVGTSRCSPEPPANIQAYLG